MTNNTPTNYDDCSESARKVLEGWLHGGASVFEMTPDEAVLVQRFYVKDGEPFNEQSYRERHRNGVVRRALDGTGVPQRVLESMGINLLKERTIMSETTTTTTTPTAKKRALVSSVAKDDRVWREAKSGAIVSLYTQEKYNGMVNIYNKVDGNLARKPTLKAALAYCAEHGYIIRGATKLLRGDKALDKLLAAFKASNGPKKDSKPAPVKPAKAANHPVKKKAAKKTPKKAKAGSSTPAKGKAARPARKRAARPQGSKKVTSIS